MDLQTRVCNVRPSLVCSQISVIVNYCSPTSTRILGDERRKMLFSHIVTKTRKVAIGPLEYCGNGTIIRTSHGEKL